MAYILLVDDNEVIRTVTKFSLQYRHSITLADSGMEGIKLAESSHFDLIITDINMPEMDGIEFIKKIRSIKSCASIPILVLTANLDEYKDKAKEAGATGWILKPFEPAVLLETIDKVLK